ncbi:MAG TPA: hypothetical protein VMG12_15235, partial [Polyangiaceae bacterium]|nr:hypothetical protein [Polyangiaceae bacterium]
PVTPAVDVHSLGAVLQELIGDGAGEAERDELANIVRGLLQQGPTGGFSSVEAFANALQDAVRRTGTVVARQSIGAQVRGVCEQYLLERRRQVRGLRETEWGDQREALNARASSSGAAAPGESSAPSADELEVMEAAGEDDAGALKEYDEASDDAVTRIYDGEELEKDGAGQPQAWMHDSRPPDSVRSGWSRWAVVTLLGVLVAVASGAAFMASRSVARTPAALPTAETKVAAASGGEARKPAAAAPAAQPVVERASAKAEGTADGTLAAVRGQETAEDDDAKPAASAAVVEDDDDSNADGASERATTRRPVLKRVAVAPRRARAAARSASASSSSASSAPAPAPRAEAPAAAEPATVGVLDLPEAREEEPEEPAPAPKAPAPKPAAAQGDGDLVIEEAPKVAFLSVDATPYATVFIDGEKKGITPLVRLELSPGLHRMIARTEDGRTKRFTLQLDPGKTETVKVSWEE